MLMLTLDVLRRVHEDVFNILPRQLAEVEQQLRSPALGWAPWDARSALQWQQHQACPVLFCKCADSRFSRGVPAPS